MLIIDTIQNKKKQPLRQTFYRMFLWTLFLQNTKFGIPYSEKKRIKKERFGIIFRKVQRIRNSEFSNFSEFRILYIYIIWSLGQPFSEFFSKFGIPNFVRKKNYIGVHFPKVQRIRNSEFCWEYKNIDEKIFTDQGSEVFLLRT